MGKKRGQNNVMMGIQIITTDVPMLVLFQCVVTEFVNEVRNVMMEILEMVMPARVSVEMLA